MIEDRLVTVLFARRDSIYKTLPNCDVWDEDRDARKWNGVGPIVAHPPCRAWGRLRSFAKPAPGEAELATWAVEQVRIHGGILEHPYLSTLWNACRMPVPSQGFDDYGGWTIAAPQFWFGHAAEKATWFYVVGVRPGDEPQVPLVLGEPDFVVQSRKRSGGRPHMPKGDRDRTPLQAALWLLSVARRVAPSSVPGCLCQIRFERYGYFRAPEMHPAHCFSDRRSA